MVINTIKLLCSVVIALHILLFLFVILPAALAGGRIPSHLKGSSPHQYAEWLIEKARALK